MVRKDREVTDRQAAVTANTQVVQTYQQQFQIGQRDLLDLLDSENQLFLSQVDLATTQTDAQFARYRVLASVGRLTAAMGVTSYFAE